MQLVVDISEDTFFDLKKKQNRTEVDNAILNGTPLPKGHGRLIDADRLLEYGACPNDCNGTTTCMESYEHLHCPIRVFDIESINDAPTIIEADKEREDE